MIGSAPTDWLPELCKAVMQRVEVAEDTVTVTLRSLELRRLLVWDGKTPFRGRPADWSLSEASYGLELEVRTISAERWPSLHIEPRKASGETGADPKLVALIKAARQAQRLVDENRDLPIEDLAKKLACRPTHFARLIRLNYLAPDIVTAILDGTQPTALNRKVLLHSNVPTSWAVQRKLFGFPAPMRQIAPRRLYGRGLWPSALQEE